MIARFTHGRRGFVVAASLDVPRLPNHRRYTSSNRHTQCKPLVVMNTTDAARSAHHGARDGDWRQVTEEITGPQLALHSPMMLRYLGLALIVATGCTDTRSSAAAVNSPGSWQVSFERIKDLGEPPYVEFQPAPEYPTRIMHAPATDAASCTPGCTCEFISAVDDCTGELSLTCHATGGLIETCPDQQTVLDCSHSTFDDDSFTTAICVLQDLTMPNDFGYKTIRRYRATFERRAFD